MLLSSLLPILALAAVTIWQQQPRHPHSTPTTDNLCHPSLLRDFCRVGCPDQIPPTLTRRIEPNINGLRHPLASGVTIMELGVDLQGQVVSSCVLRRLRDDFDKAAQAATWQWRFRLPRLTGGERGFVVTVAVCTPDQHERCRNKPETLKRSATSLLSNRSRLPRLNTNHAKVAFHFSGVVSCPEGSRPTGCAGRASPHWPVLPNGCVENDTNMALAPAPTESCQQPACRVVLCRQSAETETD